MGLIHELGLERYPSDKTLYNVIEFVRKFVYCGKEGENLVSTKLRMYEEQTVKRSSALPPDPDSLKNDILRKHHQAYYWLRCLDSMLDTLPFTEYGWQKVNNTIVPIWYNCPQFPPSNKKRKRVEESGNKTNSDVIEPPKKQTKSNIDSSAQIIPQFTEVDNSGELEYDQSDNFDTSHNDDDDDEWEHFSDFSPTDNSSDSDWEL